MQLACIQDLHVVVVPWLVKSGSNLALKVKSLKINYLVTFVTANMPWIVHQ